MPENNTPPRDDLYRSITPGFEFRDNDGDGRTLFGHFAKFNEWTEINSMYEGHFMERIAPGAFKKTIRENGRNMRVLFNHGHDTLGDQVLGSIEDLREDDQGAYYEVGLFDGIPPLLENGLRAGQYGASFRFKVMKEDFDRDAEPSEHNPEGLPERTIREAAVSEFGPVTFPAYPGATSGTRSLTDWVRSIGTGAPPVKLETESALSEPEAAQDAHSGTGAEQPVIELLTPTVRAAVVRQRRLKAKEKMR